MVTSHPQIITCRGKLVMSNAKMAVAAYAGEKVETTADGTLNAKSKCLCRDRVRSVRLGFGRSFFGCLEVNNFKKLRTLFEELQR